MKLLLRYTLTAAICLALGSPVAGKKSSRHSKSGKEQKLSREQIEAATRLQIFLDRANFSPGPINGRYSEFTWKALTLYRQSRGEPPPAIGKPDTAPDTNGLDLASIGPPVISYGVVESDVRDIGPVPKEAVAQAKLQSLPYHDAAEAIAEKFHCDIHFLEQLNPGKTKTVKVGDQLMVPNVEPFELAAVKDLIPGSEAAAANDLPEENNGPPSDDKSADAGSTAISIKIDTKTNILGVFEADKLVAASPVTVGSAQTASPIGEWKVTRIAKLPKFRYDKEMLKHGQRSGDFHMLPPGPNSLVGVIWIALNKKGIGIHGTAEPETIGRAASHGCVRLTNWDAVRLAQKVKPGVPVSIH